MSLRRAYAPTDTSEGVLRVDIAKRYGVYETVREVVARNQPVLEHFFWCGRRFGGLAKTRREVAWALRQRGLLWKQVGEVLGLTDANARKGAIRHERARKLAPRD